MVRDRDLIRNNSILKRQVGAPSGVAQLDADQRLPVEQLPDPIMTTDLADYAHGTFATSLTAGLSGTNTGTGYYVVIGKLAIVTLPAWSGTSNTTSGFSGSGVPTAARPARTQTVAAFVKDNGGNYEACQATLATDGTFAASRLSGNFTSTGVRGWLQTTFVYSLE